MRRRARALLLVVSISVSLMHATPASADTRHAGPFAYVRTTFGAGLGNFFGGDYCPPGFRFTGAGGRVGGDGGKLTNIGSVDDPSGSEPDTFPDDASTVGGYSDAAKPATTFTVCRKDPTDTLTYTGLSIAYGTSSSDPVGATSPACSSKLIGGGSTVSGSDQTKVSVDSSYPEPSGDWVLRGAKATTTDARTFKAIAVCAPSTGPRIRIVRREGVVDEGKTRKIRVRCPGSSHVSAGGIRGVRNIATSAPFDGPDPDHAPDDGWVGVVHNMLTAPAVLRVYAICVG